MMLSDQDIRAAIASGALAVTPFHDEAIRACGITMCLGPHLLKPIPGTVVDVKNEIVPDYEELLIEDNQPYALKPGDFVLGHTYETVTVGSELGFFIEGRSTLARVGLTIVQTAMMVYPGHRNRTVTLEIANHGANTILLYPRMKIARVALFQLKTKAAVLYDDKGKYRKQSIVGRPIFKNEIFDPS